MTSVKKDPKLLYSIEDNVYSLPIENQKIKLKKGTKLFEQLNDKIKIYRNNKESVTVNKVAGKTFLILEQDGIFNLVSDVKHSKKKSYLFLSNQYRRLEKEKKTAKSLIIPGIIGFVIFGLTFLLTNFYFFPFIIVILGGTIDIVLRQIFNINSLYIATILSILVGLYFLICMAIYDSGVISIHKSKDTIKSIKYQFKKFSYQIRKQNSIEKLLNGMTVGCRVVKFPYLVGENRTEPKIIFFIYQNYWDILRLPIWYFKCKYKKH